ncbi:unnamed protein product [Peronospora farinosa]|uniref:Uncharacterized protein n=1 Tax=Peronospora farinosa TaxID=134698 RepID=A0AAV0U4U8_9STRA|nr:unnamed protein product [Peronospora farinosa]
MDRAALKAQIDQLYDCLDTQQDVLDNYEALYDVLHSQETRCARLEREIQADCELAGSFAKFVSYKYNFLCCELQIATRSAEEYRQELEQIGQLEMEIADLRSSLLDATAARHKAEERFQFQLAAVQNKLAAALDSAKSANEQAAQAKNSESQFKSRYIQSQQQLHDTRLQLDAIRIERDQLAQEVKDRNSLFARLSARAQAHSKNIYVPKSP